MPRISRIHAAVGSAAAVLLTAAVLFAATAARAQTWVPVGPPGGDVRALATDPRDPLRRLR